MQACPFSFFTALAPNRAFRGCPAAERRKAGTTLREIAPREAPHRRARGADLQSSPVLSLCRTQITSEPELLTRLVARRGCVLRDGLRRLSCGRRGRSEDRSRLVVAFAADLDLVTHFHQRKELFQVALRHTDAAMRSRLADGLRRVGSVDAVSLTIQSHPAIAERIARPRRDDFAFVVVGWGDHATDDVE